MDRRNFLQGLGSVAVTGALAEQASTAFPASKPESRSPTPTRPVVKVCGVGAGGSKIVNRLMAIGVEGVTEYACIAADESDLARCTAHRKLLVGHGDYSSNRSVASRLAKPWETVALLDGADVVVLIAGLGGDDDAAIATDVVFRARKSGRQVASLLLMPFHHDIDKDIGARRGMELPQMNSHVSMVISTGAIRDGLGHRQTKAEFLAATDYAVLRSLQAILAMTATGLGLLQAAPEEAGLASAKIYAAELLREVTIWAIETEVTISEMRSSASSLRAEMSNLESATSNHYLAYDAFHSSQADVYAANARVSRIEFAVKGFESQANLKAMLADREQMMQTLQERRDVLERAADELTRLDYNCRAWGRNIKRSREFVAVWSEDLKQRLAELTACARLIDSDPEMPKSIAHATAVLDRAESALGDIEIEKLVSGVEEYLA